MVKIKFVTIALLLYSTIVLSQCYNNPEGNFAEINSAFVSEDELDSLGGCYTFNTGDFPACYCFNYAMGDSSESYIFRLLFKATASDGAAINTNYYLQSNASGANAAFDFVSDRNYVLSETIYDSYGNQIQDSASYVYGSYYQEGAIITLCIEFDTTGLKQKTDVKICLGSNGNNSTLPVEFIDVKANWLCKYNENAVNLSWITLSEYNNDKFIIQKSNDAKSWIDFNEVDGAGNSNVLLNYNVIDYNPNNEATYYRIKQIDFDGKYSYSKVVVIEHNATLNTFKLFPNPANKYITVTNDSQDTEVIEIYSSTGALVYNSFIKERLYIDVSSYAKGVYTVRVNGRVKRLVISM